MNKPKRHSILNLILFALVFCPVSSGALMTFQPNDGNVQYFNDVYKSTGFSDAFQTLGTGDYDGNGLDDVAVCMMPYAGHRTIVLFLSPFEAESSFSIKKTMEIRYAIPGVEFNYRFPQSLAMADLNGDGMADLILGRYDVFSGYEEVNIVLGKKNAIGDIDLDEKAPDCRIIGVSQVAAGDFDGDGISDLAMTKVGSAVGYIGLGGSGVFSGIIDLTIANPFHRISLGGNLYFTMSGDFNKDKKTDFAFSSPGRVLLGEVWREVDIVFGTDTLPKPPSPSSLPIDVRIIGNPDSELYGQTVGDVTGDGRSELFLWQKGGTESNTIWALDGADISGGKPVLLQSTGQPNSVDFYPVGITVNNYPLPMVAVDFDGDGADDFFPEFKEYDRLSGFLTSAIHPGGINLSAVGSPIMEWVGNFSILGSGDLNGDGFQDLVAYSDFYRLYSPYGALRVLYGFRPLTNPSVRALVTAIASPRISLVLSVDGNPTEMLLSGDITNEFKDKWIPFKSVQEVLISPTDGSKTVSVIFKNAVGRTSDRTQTTVDIQAGSSSVVTGNNRLRPGGTVAFDCHVLTSGTLRARIFSSKGKAVLDLEDRAVDPGIYPLFWDGRNESGNQVTRGVYYLVIEANGSRTKKEILVE